MWKKKNDDEFFVSSHHLVVSLSLFRWPSRPKSSIREMFRSHTDKKADTRWAHTLDRLDIRMSVFVH